MTPGAHWRDALRLIRRSPRELPAIVLVLSLAIGALAAAYVVIDAVVFKPLPFPRPESLVRVWNAAAPSGRQALSGRELALLNEEHTLFPGAAPYVSTAGHVGSRRESDAVRLRGIVTTPRLFAVLGVSPVSQWVDRLDEPRPSGTLPIVVSERLRARGIVQGTAGERLYVDGVVHEVIAIMPAAFWFPDPTVDYWVPALSDASLSSGWSGPVIARLVADTTPGTGQAGLRAMAAGNNRSLELIVREWRLDQLEPVKPVLASIQQVVGLLTLLALLNLSWVLAARARRFERQSAVMGALGAPAYVLVLGRLWEAILFAVASVPPAMVVAWVVVKGLALHGSAFVPRLAGAGLTRSALLIAALAGLIIASAASVPGLLLTAHASRRHDLLQRVTSTSQAAPSTWASTI